MIEDIFLVLAFIIVLIGLGVMIVAVACRIMDRLSIREFEKDKMTGCE